MAISRVFSTFFLLLLALFFAVASPAALAQSSPAPAPAPASASSDGTAIDQGIAYVLMVLALALTYIIH